MGHRWGGTPREGRHSQGPRAPPGTSWRLRSASLGRGIRGGPLGWAPPLWASLSLPAKWALTSAPGSGNAGLGEGGTRSPGDPSPGTKHRRPCSPPRGHLLFGGLGRGSWVPGGLPSISRKGWESAASKDHFFITEPQREGSSARRQEDLISGPALPGRPGRSLRTGRDCLPSHMPGGFQPWTPLPGPAPAGFLHPFSLFCR